MYNCWEVHVEKAIHRAYPYQQRRLTTLLAIGGARVWRTTIAWLGTAGIMKFTFPGRSVFVFSILLIVFSPDRASTATA